MSSWAWGFSNSWKHMDGSCQLWEQQCGLCLLDVILEFSASPEARFRCHCHLPRRWETTWFWVLLFYSHWKVKQDMVQLDSCHSGLEFCVTVTLRSMDAFEGRRDCPLFLHPIPNADVLIQPCCPSQKNATLEVCVTSNALQFRATVCGIELDLLDFSPKDPKSVNRCLCLRGLKITDFPILKGIKWNIPAMGTPPGYNPHICQQTLHSTHITVGELLPFGVVLNYALNYMGRSTTSCLVVEPLDDRNGFYFYFNLLLTQSLRWAIMRHHIKKWSRRVQTIFHYDRGHVLGSTANTLGYTEFPSRLNPWWYFYLAPSDLLFRKHLQERCVHVSIITITTYWMAVSQGFLGYRYSGCKLREGLGLGRESWGRKPVYTAPARLSPWRKHILSHSHKEPCGLVAGLLQCRTVQGNL